MRAALPGLGERSSVAKAAGNNGRDEATLTLALLDEATLWPDGDGDWCVRGPTRWYTTADAWWPAFI